MKQNTVPFAILRRVLTGLGFVETRVPGSHLVFEHAPSHTVFLFRTYRPRDKVIAANLISVRKHLDEKGLIGSESFDDLLHQPSA
jgi:predicted RNA binding protein YcfA (HicA-like mRNA interferase family)